MPYLAPWQGLSPPLAGADQGGERSFGGGREFPCDSCKHGHSRFYYCLVFFP